MHHATSGAYTRPGLLRGFAATFITLAVLFGVMIQQQSLAAPVGLGARTGITAAQSSQDLRPLLVHHKGHGHRRHHVHRGHRFKKFGFGRSRFSGHGHGFRTFRFGGHRGFRTFRHRRGFGGHRRWRH